MDMPLATHHPEQYTGELFFINATAQDFAAMSWRTKRKGQVAYDGQGRALSDQENWFPVFLKEEEIAATQKSLMEVRNHWQKQRTALVDNN